MAIPYGRSSGNTINYKSDSAPYITSIPGATRPNSRESEKLPDQFHSKMRVLHYALATEKSYRHWIIEFLRFHRVSGKWRHPAKMRVPELLPTEVSGNQALAAGSHRIRTHVLPSMEHAAGSAENTRNWSANSPSGPSGRLAHSEMLPR